MTSWQKRARIGVAVFGVVFAGIVYSAIGERQPAAPPEPVRRVDPKAIAEVHSGVRDQLSGGEQPYEITFERAQQYEDGSTRLFGVRVTVRNRGGRDFVITSDEAYAATRETDLRLTGTVKVVATDGFELTTDEATFNQNTGLARAVGPVAFKKGRMSGSGVGMTYDQPKDVLRFDASARVLASDAAGRTVVDFTAGTATLDRVQNVLSLENAVHIVRGEQIIDADRAVARLTESDDIVTYLELRGSARVSGGGSAFDSMSARDIDLDYTNDGETLERLLLVGDAAIAMTGMEGVPGRQMSGGRLDLHLAADGSLTSAAGQTRVRVELPAAEGGTSRIIEADAFEAEGEAGQGLTSAVFTSPGCGIGAARDRCVVYRERGHADAAPQPRGASGGTPREARSRQLAVSLAGYAVSSATFTGAVTFEEEGLTASAAEAAYTPDKGTLVLTGRDAGRRPRVEETQVTIDAGTIDVSLDGRRMTAMGEVETVLRGGGAPRTGGSATESAGAPASKMPRLLQEGETVQINADALEYAGAGGKAMYTGNALLSQGTSTTIRGDTLTVDRETGDLTVTGQAISRLVLDTGNSVGRADEIRYDDTRRTITYSITPPGPATGTGAAAPAPAAARRVQVSVPDADVGARRVEIVLASEGSTIERLEAYAAVSVRVGSRTATGARLTYHAPEGRYVIDGAPGVPVSVIDRSTNACSETTGSTLTFFKGTDRMTVDGKEFMRTQTKGGGPCGPLPSSR